jgi:hypothetical protein
MSTYSGKWPQSTPFSPSDIQVNVDGHSLPSLASEVAGAGQVFGWGSFSRWADIKLLAYSMMLYEMRDVLKLPEQKARHNAIALSDFFVDEVAIKFDKQWTMSSEEIQQWIEKRHSEIWSLTRY